MQGAGRGGHCGETENDLGDDLYNGNKDMSRGRHLFRIQRSSCVLLLNLTPSTHKSIQLKQCNQLIIVFGQQGTQT